MASSSKTMQTREDDYTKITLDEEDLGGIDIGEPDDEGGDERGFVDFRWAVVGRFLTEKTINVSLMKNIMASVWRLVRCMRVKVCKSNLFFFSNSFMIGTFSEFLIMARGHLRINHCYAKGLNKVNNLPRFLFSPLISGFKCMI